MQNELQVKFLDSEYMDIILYAEKLHVNVINDTVYIKQRSYKTIQCT